MSFFVFYKG